MKVGVTRSRWERLEHLVSRCEKLLEFNSRLDGHASGRGRPTTVHVQAQRELLCDRLTILEERVDHEIDKLTALRLRVDLQLKMKRSA